MLKEIQFSELMCARFCHDIAGSVGAISNSIDFLDSKNEVMKAKAIDLVKFSSDQAINRVTFFRRAYGYSSNSIEANLLDIEYLITRFLDGTKHELVFQESWKSTNVSGGLGKLILNAALIISTLAMHRGKMSLSFDSSSGRVEMHVESSSYKINEDLLKILQGSGEDIEKTTRNIQHFYTYHVANSINYDIEINSVADGVMLVLSGS